MWDGASAFNGITPNNYVLREKWADVAGGLRANRPDHVGAHWEGSGIGPTVDGRLGIDIAAPGNTVFASLASNTNYHHKIQGGDGFYTTQDAVSAAAPQVTGIIALMLEMNPTLDATQVRDILRQTARRDDFTGPEPNTVWGYGKIDAFAAIERASQMPGAKPYYSLDRNEIIVDFPTGSEAPAPHTVSLTAGNGAGAFTVASSAPWLSATPSNGTAPAALTVNVNPNGLSAGDYSAEITVTSVNGQAIPQTIMVHLHVRTPAPLITEVVDGAAFQAGFTNGGWVAIKGFGLAKSTRIWSGEDFNGSLLPTVLDDVRVSIGGVPAYVYFVSPNQINVLAPDNTLNNTVMRVTVTTSGAVSNEFLAFSSFRNPEFLRFDGRHIAAIHGDGSLLGPSDLYGGAVALTPAKPGEIILLYGTGCGPTSPVTPADRVVSVPGLVTVPVSVNIGGKAATVAFAGQVGSGLCQLNVTVPDVPDGDAEVVWTVGPFVSADGSFIRVKR